MGPGKQAKTFSKGQIAAMLGLPYDRNHTWRPDTERTLIARMRGFDFVKSADRDHHLKRIVSCHRRETFHVFDAIQTSFRDRSRFVINHISAKGLSRAIVDHTSGIDGQNDEVATCSQPR